MATSGTVGRTVIQTSQVIEHALRRCKVKPAMQSPEIIAIAQENLYLTLTAMATRGLNLWCVEKTILGVTQGQATYVCPGGTVDVLNVIYSQPTRVTGTDTTAINSVTTELTTATKVVRVGVKISAITAPSDTLVLEHSTDGVTWTTVQSVTKTDWATGAWYWYDLDPSITNVFFRASFTGDATFSEFYLATQVYDLPLTQWSRDTWSVINNKAQQGRPSVNYYLEKLLTPQVSVWPVPNNDYDQLSLWVHRQVQDIGTLVQEIEVPQRWFESIIWQLAVRLAFELDIVDPGMIPNIVQMADKMLLEVEDGESDGAPIMLQPGISVYTR